MKKWRHDVQGLLQSLASVSREASGYIGSRRVGDFEAARELANVSVYLSEYLNGFLGALASSGFDLSRLPGEMNRDRLLALMERYRGAHGEA